METRTDITTLSEEQLRELVGRLSAKLEQMERKNTKLKQMMGDMADSASDREMECEDRCQQREVALKRELEAARTEAEMWKEKFRQMERRALVAEARLEEKEHAQPMTIIYGNHATPVYGEVNTIHELNNSTNNHKSKSDMNIENFYNNGEIKQLGDGNTMNVHEAQETQTARLAPSQEQVRNAILEMMQTGFEQAHHWALFKVLAAEGYLPSTTMTGYVRYLQDIEVCDEGEARLINASLKKANQTYSQLAAKRIDVWSGLKTGIDEAPRRMIEAAERFIALLQKG